MASASNPGGLGIPFGSRRRKTAFGPLTMATATANGMAPQAGWKPHYGLGGAAWLRGAASNKPAAPAGFTPWVQPTEPPPGSYDPSLDAQGDNEALGYLYAGEDYGTKGQRLTDDYQSALARSRQDYGRTVSDLNLRGTQETQDYGTHTADLSRAYQNLANTQRQRAAQSGVMAGGALVQALAKRGANQGRAQGGLDLAHSRFQGGLSQALLRAGEDQSYNEGVMGTNYDRGVFDNTQTFGRATETHALFGPQLTAAKVFNASQNGELPAPPENEHTVNGQTFRTIVHNGVVYRQHPDGKLVPIRRVKK